VHGEADQFQKLTRSTVLT
jgi:hypothetical protein